jgi:hypothetical protein
MARLHRAARREARVVDAKHGRDGRGTTVSSPKTVAKGIAVRTGRER